MNTLHQRIISHEFFDGMKPEHLALLDAGAREVTKNPGEVLFREGEPANQFFLIENGSVALEMHIPSDGTVQLALLGEGDVLGWSWLFPPFSWHLQARVIEPSTLIALSGAHLLVTAEHDHDFGYELMKRISQVVIKRLQFTRKQLLALQPQPSGAS